MNITDIRTSNHETNSTDCKTDQEQQPNGRKRIGPIRRFRLHAYGLRTARTEVQAPRLWLANS